MRLEQYKCLAETIAERYPTWLQAAPASYRQGIFNASRLLTVTIQYGQNTVIGADDQEQHFWNRQTDFSKVARMSMAYAFHYRYASVMLRVIPSTYTDIFHHT